MQNSALLEAGLTAARAGDLEEAARLFARLIQEEPGSEQGWLGLGLCVPDRIKREYCLRRVLAINPNNTHARQALEHLEGSAPVVLLATQMQPPPVPPKVPALTPEPAPVVSPFFFEQAPNTVQDAVLNEVSTPSRMDASAPTPFEPEAEASLPDQPVPKKKKKFRLLTVLLWLAISPVVVCLAGGAYLYFSGKATRWLPTALVPTSTSAQLSTQTASPSPSTIPTASASPTFTPPAPTATPANKPTLVYTPIFNKGACRFAPPEGVTATCGSVSVPENRANLHSKTIQLAVVVFHSTSATPAPDPVVFLQGGPGGEAVQLSTDNYETLVKPFLAARDFIAFDQRGTGISIPTLDCGDLESLYKQDISGQVPATSRELVYANAFRSCHGALAIAGIDLNAYTTLASSDDLYDIITALGYSQVDLYSVSYGTRLALVSMREHPGILRSVVLDSVVPVEAKLFNEDPQRYGSALQALFDSCASDQRCNAAYPNLKTVFWDLVDQLDVKPAEISRLNSNVKNTGKVDGADLIGVVLSLLKSGKFISYAPEIIYSIQSGDYSSFVAMQAGLPYQFQGINLGLYISMMCHEQTLATTPQELQAAMDSQHDIGSYFRLPFFGDAKKLFDTCKLWGSIPPSTAENGAVTSSIPALVIEGKFDPVTPPAFGKQILPGLTNSYYMEFPNLGHAPSASDPSGCAFDTMLAFLNDPARQPNMSCLTALPTVDFILP